MAPEAVAVDLVVEAVAVDLVAAAVTKDPERYTDHKGSGEVSLFRLL